MDLKEIIIPDLAKASSVFSGDDRMKGLYLPVYQRKYTWGTKQFQVLFNDISETLNQPSQTDDITDTYRMFFGNTIIYQDKRKAFVYPKGDEHYPKNANIIVDGQQRITTLALLASRIVPKLKESRGMIAKLAISESKKNKLLDLVDHIIKDLECYYALEFDDVKIPKIIRSHEDQWSIGGGRSMYLSPVAEYFYDVIHGNERGQGTNTTDIFGEKKLFQTKLERLDRIIESFCSQDLPASYKITKLKDLKTLLENANLVETLFQSSFPTIDHNSFDEELKVQYEIYVRRLILGYFIHNCLAVVSVNVHKDYARAFVIFNSLNSTGKRLTPLECLKPVVISSIKDDLKDSDVSRIRESEKFTLFEEIEEIISLISNDPDDKDAAESRIVRIFSLVLSGTKLPTDLEVQQAELKYRFIQLGTKELQTRFLRLLKAVATVYLSFSKNRRLPIKRLITGCAETETDPSENMCRILARLLPKQPAVNKMIAAEANFGMCYLKDSDCYLGLAPIARYYFDAIEKDTREASEALCHSIRATAAFLAVWQTSDVRSERKDDCFRNIFLTNNTQFKLYELPATDPNSLPHVSCLKQYYIHKLIDRLRLPDVDSDRSDKQVWTDTVNDLPIYRVTRKTAKMFIMLKIHEDRIVMLGKETKPVQLKELSATMLELMYQEFERHSVYHIIPREITRRDDRFEQLWNMALMEKRINKFFKGQADLYRLIVEADDKKFKELCKGIEGIDYEEAKEVRKYYFENGYVQLLAEYLKFKDLGECAELAMERAAVIIDLNWETLAVHWLDWQDSKLRSDTRQS